MGVQRSVIISAVDENGGYQVETLNVGDVWYFPRGVGAYNPRGRETKNEHLLVFDDSDFDKSGMSRRFSNFLISHYTYLFIASAAIPCIQ